MRYWWLSGVVVALVACAPRARAPAPTSAASTPVRSAAREPGTVRAEQPLTRARLMLLGDSALAFDNWRFGREPVCCVLRTSETWTRVALPKGFDSDEIMCSALGCRLGPYFRAGWGETASTRARPR